MSKAVLLFLIFTLLAWGGVRVSAQGLVAFPTGNAAWTVSFTPSSSASAETNSNSPQKKPSQIDVTQLNHVKRIQITWTDGTTTEQWAIPPMPVNFEEDPRNGSIDPNLADSQSEGYIKFAIPCDSRAFRWLTPATLKEKDPISYEGTLCFHYAGQDSPVPGAEAQPREAWIDAKTLLPVALDTGTSLAVFTFASKPPTGPLVMPVKFQKAINYYKLVTGYR